MSKGILGDREKALEDSYFREQDGKLLRSLRKESALDEIAVALSGKLELDDPDLLTRTRQAGITAETAPAFLVAPLIQAAWAEGKVTKAERNAVLRLARERGIDQDSPAHAQLLDWLAKRPPDSLFDAALQVLRCGLSVLPANEREERIDRILHACHHVAEASGSEVARLMGLGDGVSRMEESVLDSIAKALRTPWSRG